MEEQDIKLILSLAVPAKQEFVDSLYLDLGAWILASEWQNLGIEDLMNVVKESKPLTLDKIHTFFLGLAFTECLELITSFLKSASSMEEYKGLFN